MHPAVAIVLCIVNICIPGFGTIISGFLALCGAANPDSHSHSKIATFCVNFWVGLLQLATVIIFLLGWVWSIIWGIMFITQSQFWHNPPTVTTMTTTTTNTHVAAPAPAGPPAYK